MSTIEEIEQAVSQLGPDEFTRFREWFEEFNAKRFDDRIESDARSGKLDAIADRAIANFHKGLAREL